MIMVSEHLQWTHPRLKKSGFKENPGLPTGIYGTFSSRKYDNSDMT